MSTYFRTRHSTQRQTQPAAAAVITVFTEPDALPGAEGEAVDAATGFDGQGELSAEQAGEHVGGHVVIAFQCVAEVGQVAGHQAAQEGIHVVAHVGVGVLIEGQRGGGVQQLHMQQADTDRRHFGQCLLHLVTDEVKTALAGGEGESVASLSASVVVT